eukprot:9566050-Alexandrium_andersonii.AAC.1
MLKVKCLCRRSAHAVELCSHDEVAMLPCVLEPKLMVAPHDESRSALTSLKIASPVGVAEDVKRML